jgi:hypothetical protein
MQMIKITTLMGWFKLPNPLNFANTCEVESFLLKIVTS